MPERYKADLAANKGKDKSYEDIESQLSLQIQEAEDWRRDHVEPEQEKATEYYMGRAFGDEVEGRSRVVMTEVRDVVRQTLPSLLRIFCGPHQVVRYGPQQPEDVKNAEQATDVINHIFLQENCGFLTLQSVFKDALIRKIGIAKWWWEDFEKREKTFERNLLEEEIAVLTGEEGVEVEIIETIPPPSPLLPTLYNVEVTRVTTEGRIKVEAVPPEEFIFSPSARSLNDARLVAHVRYLPADELRDMGVPDEMIDEAGHDREWDDGLAVARRIDETEPMFTAEEQTEEAKPVRFAEVYTKADFGDGNCLYKISCVGSAAKIWEYEPVSRKPFALFCPDPEPHTIIGLSQADLVMDLQRINSQLLRGMLDSLALSLNPQQEVVQGQVEMKDVLNPSLGRIIRVRQPGMVREITIPFVGQQALPVLEFTQAVKEQRTGMTRASAGLDADVLQSTTRAAVQATFSAAQQQIEMVARIFAETGMKDLFEGLLELFIQNQDKPKTIRLRNEFVEIDPRYWNANMDVVVDVGLGTGMIEEKLTALSGVVAQQKELMVTGSPLVSNVELRTALGKIVELTGYKDTNEFFRPWSAEEEQQMQEALAQQPPPPSEVEVYREVEMAKIQAKQQETQEKMALEVAKAQLEDQRERERMRIEFELKKMALQVQTATAVDKNNLERDKLLLQDEAQENEAILGLMDRTQNPVQEAETA